MDMVYGLLLGTGDDSGLPKLGMGSLLLFDLNFNTSSIGGIKEYIEKE